MTSATNPAASAATLVADLNLQIEHRPIAELRAAGRKSRHHGARQMEALKRNLAEFGFIIPIVLNVDGKILAGNARVDAAKALGLATAPCVVVGHLSPEQQRAFVIADNRLAELGSWNREVLKLELEDLSSLELSFDLDVIGFTLPEIEAIRFGGDDDASGPDNIPDLQPDPVSRQGDLWRLGQHRLLVGDATSPEALDRLMGGEAARTVFTDPPYNVRIEGHVTGSKAHGEFVQGSGEMSDAEFTGFLEKVHGQIDRALVDGGIAYVCMDWRHAGNVLTAASAARLSQLNLCVWDKGAPGMGSLYRSQHELVFVLKKGKAAHLNNVELGRNGRNRSNVWAYDGVGGFGADKARERSMHPTVKPMALVRDALLDASQKGDLVLDLFGGSGTTLIAAETCGRRARLMELDPKYADVIILRWEAVSGHEAVHDGLGASFQTLSYERPEQAPPVRVRVRRENLVLRRPAHLRGEAVHQRGLEVLLLAALVLADSVTEFRPEFCDLGGAHIAGVHHLGRRHPWPLPRRCRPAQSSLAPCPGRRAHRPEAGPRNAGRSNRSRPEGKPGGRWWRCCSSHIARGPFWPSRGPGHRV